MKTKFTLRSWNVFFFSAVAALLTMSLLVMFGWYTHSQALVQIHPEFASMKFNTALGFFLSAIGLMFLRLNYQIAARVSTILLTILGLLSLLEWILHVDFAIDNLFIQDWLDDPTAPPGRMSIPTALCFACCGLALILTTLQKGKNFCLSLVTVLGSIVLAIGLIGLIDYGLSVFTKVGWQHYTVMALHTTSGFCLLGSALILIGLQEDKRVVKYRTQLVPIGTILLMFCLTISLAIENKDQQYAKMTLQKKLNNEVKQVTRELNLVITMLSKTAKHWESQNTPKSQSEWQTDSQIFIESLPFLKAISLVNRAYKSEWLVTDSLDARLVDIDNIISLLNEDSNQTLNLVSAKTAEFQHIFIITVPVYSEQNFDGFLLAILDLTAFFDKISQVDLEDLSWLSVNVGYDNIYNNLEQRFATEDNFAIEQQSTIHGLTLLFRSGYLENSPHRGLSVLSLTVFISSTLFVFVLLVAIYAYQKSRALSKVLNRQKERFYQVIEAAPGAMLLINNKGEIELLNRKTEQLFGYQRDTLLGLNVDRLLPMEHRSKHSELRESYNQNPSLRSMAKGRELFGLHKDGHLIPLEIELCPIKTDEGLKTLASIFDLSERSKQMIALSRSKEELDRAGRIAKIGAWNVELASNQIHWSPQTYKIHEVPESVPLTLEFAFKFFNESDKELIQSAIEEATLKGTEWDLEVELTTLQKNKIWVRTQGQVEYENGVPTRLVGALQDITEKRLFISELERRNQELNNFAYVASHDLKSPLRGIDQLATWLEEDLADTLEVKNQELLRLMRSRINRMENLLTDLLAYARAGRTEADIEYVDIVNIVEQVFGFCNVDNKFALHISGEGGDYLLLKTPLETVLRNLFSNAIKHHDKEQGNLTVCIHYKDNYLQFKVADDGPGIPMEHRDRAFAMFQTLQPRDKVEGSGMGLAIVKKIIESLNGNIELKANEPHGAIFEFSWPATSNPK